MRMNIREIPSCLENVKNVLWPHLNSCVSRLQPLLSVLCGVDQTPKALWQEVGDGSEKQLLAPGPYEERGEVKASSQEANTQNGLTGC